MINLKHINIYQKKIVLPKIENGSRNEYLPGFLLIVL